jgi:D-glycero-alpha-D-manno-heptose-7-phosphate kinase
MLDHARVERVVIARAPLRISLGGGGSDLPSHFTEHGGFAVSATIDRHVHMLVSDAPEGRYRLKHLEQEEVSDPAQIEHPILRIALTRHWNGQAIDLASTGDVPPGTGLGSSGAYAVCALKALAVAAGDDAPPADLAARACTIEIDDLGLTVGKQDQYAAAFGGLNAFTFQRDGSVDVRPLEVSEQTIAQIGERFILFDTGQRRSAAAILAGQVERRGESRLVTNLGRAVELAREGAAAIESGELGRVGELMNEQWALKRERSPAASTPRVEALRQAALGGGATGAILMGAGGGGFVLCYSEQPNRVRAAVDARELEFAVDRSGATGWVAGAR